MSRYVTWRNLAGLIGVILSAYMLVLSLNILGPLANEGTISPYFGAGVSLYFMLSTATIMFWGLNDE